VWVNLAVYPSDAARVAAGQKVTITAVGSEAVSSGAISYITPVVDAQTRTITARVVLSNRDNSWRPGTFVKASVALGGGRAGVVVEREAVQTLDTERVVFVQHEPGRFKAVVVTTGEHNGQQVLIISGLAAGQEYVRGGAFELKAKIVTSSLGAHAGHGH
jgi:cobalt-zinc-cadmium efflux system membrane fusion protein